MRKRRARAHPVAGPVLAALIFGCCVGVIADRHLREHGPPRPDARAEAAVTQAPAKTPRPEPPPVDNPSVLAPPRLQPATAVEELAGRVLRFPIDSMDVEPLHGAFQERRGGGTRPHEAVDILAPRGTPVHAVEGGTVAKLFYSKAGGNTIYQFDSTERFCYYYAHLQGYAGGIHEGMAVSRSDVIGYVGTSGNAPPDTPHLHFAIFQLTPARHWWQGTPIDPYLVFRDSPHSTANE